MARESQNSEQNFEISEICAKRLRRSLSALTCHGNSEDVNLTDLVKKLIP